MKLLSIECSASPASAAIIDDGKVIASSFINTRLTHSQTLMPMVKDILSASMTSFEDIEGIAVASGPGSFTGIRIGISAVKGLAAPKNLPCVAVSTLRAMAEMFRGKDCYVCAVMDARCNQVYNAIFEIGGDKITRVCEDRALMCDELAKEVTLLYKSKQKEIIICGDGADLFYEYVSEFKGIVLANPILKYQNAAAVGLCAEKDFLRDKIISASELLPTYLRLPQAERELKAKKEKDDENCSRL